MSRHNVTVIENYYCDEPMARAKGLIGGKKTNLSRCNGKCLNCPACIVTQTGKDRQHISFEKG